ncbi:MAG: hypothetical protein WCV69_01910 [Patescibacteria group bacterium]|jgi:hypothetical protein
MRIIAFILGFLFMIAALLVLTGNGKIQAVAFLAFMALYFELVSIDYETVRQNTILKKRLESIDDMLAKIHLGRIGG